MTIRDLMLGNVYWVLTDLEHRYVLGQQEFDALKKCVLEHYITVDHESIKYCFHTFDDVYGEYYNLYDWECEEMVYFSVDEYLYYLVKHVDALNSKIDETKHLHSFDDFLKCEIAESQEKHPEIWI